MVRRGRPPIDDMPDVVTAYANKYNLSISGLCRRLGKSDNWLNKMFNGEQIHLKPYCALADYAGVSLEVLATYIKNREGYDFVEAVRVKAAKRKGLDTISTTALAAEIGGISEGMLRQLQKNSGELKALESYVFLAEKIGCKLDQLRKDTTFRALTA